MIKCTEKFSSTNYDKGYTYEIATPNKVWNISITPESSLVPLSSQSPVPTPP